MCKSHPPSPHFHTPTHHHTFRPSAATPQFTHLRPQQTPPASCPPSSAARDRPPNLSQWTQSVNSSLYASYYFQLRTLCQREYAHWADRTCTRVCIPTTPAAPKRTSLTNSSDKPDQLSDPLSSSETTHTECVTLPIPLLLLAAIPLLLLAASAVGRVRVSFRRNRGIYRW